MLKNLRLIFELAFVVLITQCNSFAQSLEQREALNIVQAASFLTYWQKAPMSLMLYCGQMYPATGKRTQEEYINWQRRNAELNLQVDKMLATFVPLIAKYMKKTPDEFQVYMTKSTDEEVIVPFEKHFNQTERARHCSDFGQLLSQMLSDDLAKPRVNMALETLRSYEGRLPTLIYEAPTRF